MTTENTPAHPFQAIAAAAAANGWTLAAADGRAGYGPGRQVFTKDGETLTVRYAGPGHPSSASTTGAKLGRKGLLANILDYLAGA